MIFIVLHLQGSQDGSSRSNLEGGQKRSTGRPLCAKKVPPEVPRRSSSIKSNESGGSVER